MEEKLYGLMEIAEQQQRAVSTALAAQEKQQAALANTVVQLQSLIGRQLVSATENAAHSGATEAVRCALANAGKEATQAVAESCRPLLAGLAGVAAQAATAESQLKGAVGWFGWRWAGLAGSIALGAILALVLSAWGAVWWQRAQLDELKAERTRLAEEVTAARSTLAIFEKRTGGVRYVEGSDGRFLLIRNDFDKLKCVGDVPCARLK